MEYFLHLDNKFVIKIQIAKFFEQHKDFKSIGNLGRKIDPVLFDTCHSYLGILQTGSCVSPLLVFLVFLSTHVKVSLNNIAEVSFC